MNEIIQNPKAFSRLDWLTLLAGAVLAVLWRYGVSYAGGPLVMATLGQGAALGITVYTLAAWLAVALLLGRDALWTRESIFCCVCSLLLAASCALQYDGSVRFISCCFILAASVLGFLSLAGVEYYPRSDARARPAVLHDAVFAWFCNLHRPVAALAALFKGRGKTVFGVFVGLLAGLPLLALLVSQLAAADSVFSAMLDGFFSVLESADLQAQLISCLWLAFMALMTFSALFFLRHAPRRNSDDSAEARPQLPVSAGIVILALLAAALALFAAVQFKYLFGGTEAAAMSGGRAEYARGGFFALVRAAALITASILLCGRACEASRAARALAVILAALGFVTLASAACRLWLYVAEYGLTVQRVLAAWAIAAVGVWLALAGIKAAKPGFRFWPAAAAAALAMWTLFSFVNVHGLVADYNMDAFLAGKLESVDVVYLCDLSPAALDALYALRDAAENGDADRRWTYLLDDTIAGFELERDNFGYWAMEVLR